MTSRGHALSRDELIRTLTSYTGITTADGAADGTTLIDVTLIDNPYISPAGIPGKMVLIMGGDARGEDSGALSFNNGTGAITLTGTGFSAQIVAGTVYRILNISSVEIDVATLLARIGDPSGDTLTSLVAKFGDIARSLALILGARWDAAGDLGTDIATILAMFGATGIFHEQADAAVNITATNAAETDVLHLNAANTRYIVRSLRLKCANPGANTVTVRLYGLVNNALTEVDSFAIDATNFGTYHSLMDMFGLPHLAGDELQVTVRASAGGPYAVTSQYSHAKTNV